MTNETNLLDGTDLRVGSVYQNPDDDRRWEVTEIETTLTVRISPRDPEDSDAPAEIARFPLPSIARKVDRGDLVPYSDDPQPDEEEGSPFPCPVCGEEFPSKQAVAGHQSAHQDQD